MTWILALTAAGMVLWGVGVREALRTRGEPNPRRQITVMRHRGRLLIGMMSRGETWMWSVDHDSIGVMGLWLTMRAKQPALSLTMDDAEAITEAVERYMAAERSVGEQLQSTRTR